MRGKSVAILFLAMACGVGASFGVVQIIARRNADKPVTTGETEGIFVAKQDVPFGEPLTSQLLRLEQWPESKIPLGAFSKLEDIKDRCARIQLCAGEPILDSKLFDKGEKAGGLNSIIEKGFRVVSVKVDSVSSSGDLVRPGDHVDVLAHPLDSRPSASGERSTRTLLQDVKVLAVNDIVGSDSNDSVAAKTISLTVTSENAERIMLASQSETIQLVMRRPGDKEIDHHEIAALPKKTLAAPEPTELVNASEPEKHSTRMMGSPVVNVFVLQPEDGLPKLVTGRGSWKITREGEDTSPGFAVTTDAP